VGITPVCPSGIINQGEHNHHRNKSYQQFEKKIYILHIFINY
jgi:hypothetical protein